MYVCMHVVHVRMYFFNVRIYDAFMHIHNTRKTKDKEEYCTLAPGARETYYLDMDRSMVTRARAHLRGNARAAVVSTIPFAVLLLSWRTHTSMLTAKEGKAEGRCKHTTAQADFTQYSMPQCLMTHSTSSCSQCLPSPLFR